jgi:hypothetical protein
MFRIVFDMSDGEKQWKELAELLAPLFPDGPESFPHGLVSKLESVGRDVFVRDRSSTVDTDGTTIFVERLRLGRTFDVLRSAIVAGEFEAHDARSSAG